VLEELLLVLEELLLLAGLLLLVLEELLLARLLVLLLEELTLLLLELETLLSATDSGPLELTLVVSSPHADSVRIKKTLSAAASALGDMIVISSFTGIIYTVRW
jgi:hypothetical protein